jgi:hypothetical protein
VAGKARLRIVQGLRVIAALSAPAIWFLDVYIWHVVNLNYHPDTYDPERYWMGAAPYLSVAFALALILAFWRMDSIRLGLIVIGIGMLSTIFMIGRL